MKDFIYDAGVKIIYGKGQMEAVIDEVSKLGNRVLIVPTGSFVSGGHYEELESCLKSAGVEGICLEAVREPLLSKVNEGTNICVDRQV